MVSEEKMVEVLASLKDIAENAETAYRFSRMMGDIRFPLGEPVIASDMKFAVIYAMYIIRGRFPEAEKNIAQDKFFSYVYYTHAIEGKYDPDSEPILTELFNQSKAYVS